jgi:hypothetical protein
MSFGSRANQVNLKRKSSCSEQSFDARKIFAADADLSVAHDFHSEMWIVGWAGSGAFNSVRVKTVSDEAASRQKAGETDGNLSRISLSRGAEGRAGGELELMEMPR